MTAMRRGIAEHMRRSLDTSAHVTSAIEVDMSKVVAIREKLKKEYEAAYGVNPTYLAFIARATAETLRDYPWVNGELRGDKIVTRNYVNLGFAVELADGKGLIVPVVKNAETLNLLGMAKAIADVAKRARDKQLTPDDVTGGTFTITNPGGYGTFHGTPVISQPQAGILGTYAIVKRPWVITDENGADAIAIRSMMNLTLTYDHRLVDGALAGRFLRDLRERLQTWGESGLLEPAQLVNLGVVDYREALELQRALAAAVAEGSLPDTVLFLEHPPTITLGRRTEEGEVHVPGRCRRRRRRGRPRRQVDLPRARAARLLPDPRPDAPRAGREAVLPRSRGGAHPHDRRVRHRGDAHRRADRRLARGPAAEDRVDRHPPLEVGLDARLRAERRPRPGAVHGLDHRLRARRLRVHVDGARARAAGAVDEVRPAAAQALRRRLRPHVRRGAVAGSTAQPAFAPPVARARRPPARGFRDIRRLPNPSEQSRLWYGGNPSVAGVGRRGRRSLSPRGARLGVLFGS